VAVVFGDGGSSMDVSGSGIAQRRHSGHEGHRDASASSFAAGRPVSS
jgi:hypothetical protein